MSNNTRTPWILRCGHEGRDVIFGYLDAPPKLGEPVTIYDARTIVAWRGGTGLHGLAATGPGDGSRISKPARVAGFASLSGYVSVHPGAEAAINAWPAL